MANPQDYRPATGTIPTDPGVYKFRDANGRVVYVGKAKNLRSRLNNYFQPPEHLHPRTRQMVFTAASVEWTVVSSEAYAWPTSKRTKSVISMLCSSVNCFTVFLESPRDGWSSRTTSL